MQLPPWRFGFSLGENLSYSWGYSCSIPASGSGWMGGVCCWFGSVLLPGVTHVLTPEIRKPQLQPLAEVFHQASSPRAAEVLSHQHLWNEHTEPVLLAPCRDAGAAPRAMQETSCKAPSKVPQHNEHLLTSSSPRPTITRSPLARAACDTRCLSVSVPAPG